MCLQIVFECSRPKRTPILTKAPEKAKSKKVLSSIMIGKIVGCVAANFSISGFLRVAAIVRNLHLFFCKYLKKQIQKNRAFEYHLEKIIKNCVQIRDFNL